MFQTAAPDGKLYLTPAENRNRQTMAETDEDCQAMLYIQPDWHEATSSEDGRAWVTVKKRGEKGRHGFLLNDDDSGVATSDDKLRVERSPRGGGLLLRHDDVAKVAFKVVLPDREFKGIHLKNIVSMDVSDGGLGVSSGDQGTSINVWETGRGVVRRSLEGHLGDIYSCRLFPSGIVVLSASADMRVKIWSAEDGSCPVTLAGHKAAVTATAIVDSGMNIVTGSKDGTLRLWSSGKMRCLEPAIDVEDAVNCCDIASVPDFVKFAARPPGDIDREDEVGTEGKLVVAGGESGWLVFVDLRGRRVVSRQKLSSAVNVVRFFDGKRLLVGTEDGVLSAYDLETPESPSAVCHDSNSSVLSLLPLPEGIVVGRADGSCVFYPAKGGGLLRDTSRKVVLSGADVDPVTAVASDGEFVYTAARDGVVRKYSISSLTFWP